MSNARSAPPRLGATVSKAGVAFAVFSEHADRIELCIFVNGHESRVALDAAESIWSGFVPGLMPGARYGYRAHGPYRPDQGDRFNPAKLLLDPYARAISGKVDWSGPVYGYRPSRLGQDLRPDRRDSAGSVPLSVVVTTQFDWGGVEAPRTPMTDTVIYETHVKSFSIRNPNIPEELRGTYLGLCHPWSIDYLKRLGVTAVELLPVHAILDDDFLVARGLTNYWGYSTLGYFAPEPRYAASTEPGEQVDEFKHMVKELHAAGIEVILDVVYNHTCEGNHLGPTLSWRGLDNRSYYRLLSGQPRYYEDDTGTGNTLHVAQAPVLRMVMDSLRYWVQEMHVDGFRFDLAPTLAREEIGFSRNAGFLRAIHQDPVLSNVKLIAEPWDIGDGGYQLGSFPQGWSEWNDRFRNVSRGFWRGDHGTMAELGSRITGSADIFGHSKRPPTASINFITAHDGFTLADLVSFERKHNFANGEDNRDGSDWNVSANNGVEGESDDPAIVALRLRQQRNLFATLLLSTGVPMIVGGDEFGRTQRGNNNPYSQDNELSWFDWRRTESQDQLRAFVQRLTRLRRRYEMLRRATFLSGRPTRAGGVADGAWFRPDGEQMAHSDWRAIQAHEVALRLLNQDRTESLLIVINGSTVAREFRLPPTGLRRSSQSWRGEMTTHHPDGDPSAMIVQSAITELPARTIVLLSAASHVDFSSTTSRSNLLRRQLLLPE